ncbi:putative eka-like protein [Erysiphe necator]|uniref:Putative eka-like protein n=1 Tax=Uncinula necator TaxID=52586 RepID=A0A0B1P6F2_UNCNE|nr:putative eka-like protein [Erysiphe necator]
MAKINHELQQRKQVTQASARPTTKTPSSRKEKTSCLKDTRLFIRLTNNHEWRKFSPAGIRGINPRNDETRQELLKGAIC